MSFPRPYFWSLLILVLAGTPAAAEVPSWLPRYHLDIRLDIDQHCAHVRERVTWTNRHPRPANELIFNAHAHFKLPDKDVSMMAKTVEILRMTPGDLMDTEGRACEIVSCQLSVVSCQSDGGKKAEETIDLRKPEKNRIQRTTDNGQRTTDSLPFHYQDDNDTALVIPLPRPVREGESVTVEIEFIMRLPQKQGRWGQWKGVTYLTHWLPVLAFYDDHGWQPTPYIPWHQPFFNEAGVYTARVVLPGDQKVACTGSITATKQLGDGWCELEIGPAPARDFSLVCSSRFQEFLGQAGPTRIRCLAFPEHEHYAKVLVQSACHALSVYGKWFGPYPYPEFSIVESYFGWNGNECSGMVMIDERIFSMPHAAENFVDYLVSHEICHQWWYNIVGTNGYAETWMDEGLATYFSSRLMNEKHGKNNAFIRYPRGLGWMPNIHREDYRYFGLYGTLGRGEAAPTVQELPKFGHIANLFSMCYDRGGKIVGMIEDRLGEAAFLDFMRRVYSRHQFRVLRVADFQRELEEYTGQSWDEFFRNWLYGAGLTDWCVEEVSVDRGLRFARNVNHGYKVTVLLQQKADYNEPTVLGFRFDDGDHYQLRIPIVPQVPVVELEEVSARVEVLPDNRVLVEAVLPSKPTQITVDPDQVLVDRDPSNNHWKRPIQWRFTPFYTFLDETDLTCAYDRWNVVAGPWFYTPTYETPWFTRATMFGLRAGAYRTQHFTGGIYSAYRTDYRDVVAGADGFWDHCPWPGTQFGFIAEQRLATTMTGDKDARRGVLFGRYVIDYGDSMYLPPFQFIETFGTFQDNLLPIPRRTIPGGERYKHQAMGGLHYHKNYLTPYWDAEGGYQFDATYSGGTVELEGESPTLGSHLLSSQFSYVQFLPECLGPLAETRVAARIYGAAGLPDRVAYFPLGGGRIFRGYDLAQRQGSLIWVGSLEWRIPLARHMTWDCCDHAVGVRDVYAAIFYDVGDVYLRGRSVDGVAHAVGVGLRLDAAWFSFVERTILRFDFAKTVNDDTPFQFWLGIEHPF